MSESKLSRKIFIKKLFAKNRLVILNENTFEEIFSFKLNLTNVFISITIGAILLIIFTTYIIAFTPLKEFIPGYSSSKLKRDATVLALKSDSLTGALKKNEIYIKSIQKVLTGELEFAKFNKDSILATPEEASKEVNLTTTEEEQNLREQVANEDKIKKGKPTPTKSKKRK